jgi:hypothetical protein
MEKEKLIIQRTVLLALVAAIVDCDENTSADRMREMAVDSYLKIQEMGVIIPDLIHEKICDTLFTYADKLDAIQTAKNIINQKQ